MDIQQKAGELAEALAASQEYERLVAAREQVDKHEAAKIMLRDFQKKQNELQQLQMEGRPITEGQTEEIRKLYELVSINPYIRELVEAEFGFSGLMMQVQEILGQALGMVDDSAIDGDVEAEEDVLQPPPKKLWTPGN